MTARSVMAAMTRARPLQRSQCRNSNANVRLSKRVQEHQPYWVALGHLQALAQQAELAAASLRRALGLTSHPRLQRYLGAQLARLRPRPE
jgi:hypothetical protein